MNSQFNTAEFNTAEFNDTVVVATSSYELFLDTGAGYVLVGSGDGSVIPPLLLYPSSSYKCTITTADGSADILFITPPSISYDGLSG